MSPEERKEGSFGYDVEVEDAVTAKTCTRRYKESYGFSSFSTKGADDIIRKPCAFVLFTAYTTMHFIADNEKEKEWINSTGIYPVNGVKVVSVGRSPFMHIYAMDCA
ncbi:hypothetical protein K1719_001069 [Acacia pycnantha]|nr:hypothetical protein K1719_001069 [Acacia pycnantha]